MKHGSKHHEEMKKFISDSLPCRQDKVSSCHKVPTSSTTQPLDVSLVDLPLNSISRSYLSGRNRSASTTTNTTAVVVCDDDDPFMENTVLIPHVRQKPGIVDPGAGVLDARVSDWNRSLARFAARMFAVRWQEGKEESAYKYLQQSQQLIACPVDIHSGKHAHQLLPSKVIGKQGEALIDMALNGLTSRPHQNDKLDELREQRQQLFLWAILWNEVKANAY